MTVTRKLVLVEPPLPSATVTVMSEVPLRPEAGVMVTVRLEPLPPNSTLAGGTSAAFVDAAESVRLVAAVSASPIKNAVAGVDWPDTVARLAMPEMTGGVLPGAGGLVTLVEL